MNIMVLRFRYPNHRTRKNRYRHCVESLTEFTQVRKRIQKSRLVTMFRIICELCRLPQKERHLAREQLHNLLNCATAGTIAFIADINPRASSDAQPEKVSSFIESVFLKERWSRIGFSEKYWNKRSRDPGFFSIWDLDVRVPLWTLIH